MFLIKVQITDGRVPMQDNEDTLKESADYYWMLQLPSPSNNGSTAVSHAGKYRYPELRYQH